MLEEKKKKVRSICDEVYSLGYCQITIDLIQDEVGELLTYGSEHVRRDEVGGVSAHIYFLLEVFNPKFEKDIDLLKRLEVALDEWVKAIEVDNVAAGNPIES